MEVYDAESVLSSTVVLYSEFYIKDALFEIVFLKNKTGVLVSGTWINRSISFEMNDAAAYFDIVLPDFLNFEWLIENICLQYSTSDSSLCFEAVIRDFGKLTLTSGKNSGQQKRIYKIKLDFNRKLELSSLPIIGSFCNPGDGFIFNKIDFQYCPEINLILSLFSNLVIKGTDIPVNIDYTQSLKPKPLKSPPTTMTDTASLPANTIHWLDINKGFSVLYFSKIGFSLFESEITLYLDASFTIAMLRIDFYELYVSTSLKKLNDIRFGLGGLMVSFDKPGFRLSGGLYQSQEDKSLYNGALGLKIGQYSFQALGSYGELPGSSEKTFFAYLMLGVPLGGPAFFFVNGLAFGFGVNRSIRLPDLQGVRQFPLVSAAMGDASSELKPDTPPEQALGALSETIVPDSGQYFISAGIRFLTFGMLESFALLNIEMGGRLVISLLGLSNASIPPKLTGGSPIMRAELAMKVVFDPDQGEFMLTAALTDRSFLFDPACKLTGGFAIGFWFKGAYSGDFIVTLGGCHHPAFQNTHYPVIPPLGVSWIVNDNISIKGESYFALTPACLMAGTSLKLLFEWGNLKAWFFAAADFILKWKPFFYQARVQISVGASYRISAFGIGKTFNVEIGASLILWGPEFSGKVRVNWYIISFTIEFGAGSENEPEPIGWNEFVDSFIPGAFDKEKLDSSTALSAASRARLGSVSLTNGLLAQYRDADDQDAYVVDGFRANFLIEQKVPCTGLFFNDQSLLKREIQLGIAPMKLNDVQMKVNVTIRNRMNGQYVTDLDAVIEYRNVPSALWGTGKPDLNHPIIPDMPVGLSVSVKRTDSIIHILPEQGTYEESVLSSSESITREVVYLDPVFKPAVHYPAEPEIAFHLLQNTIKSNFDRDQLLLETASAFGTWSQAHICTLASDPQTVLLAVPVLRTTGAAAATVY
ncbi:DUF6603 domain-containing protein [Paenibacillus sp. Z6-24]